MREERDRSPPPRIIFLFFFSFSFLFLFFLELFHFPPTRSLQGPAKKKKTCHTSYASISPWPFQRGLPPTGKTKPRSHTLLAWICDSQHPRARKCGRILLPYYLLGWWVVCLYFLHASQLAIVGLEDCQNSWLGRLRRTLRTRTSKRVQRS